MNEVGLKPLGFKVLLKPKAVEQTTSGGIILPPDVQEKDEHAQDRGEIISMAANAFSYTEMPPEERPQIGEEVYYARYAGVLYKDRSGNEYRLVNDEDITAVIL